MIRTFTHRKISDGNGGTKEELSMWKILGIPFLLLILTPIGYAGGVKAMEIWNAPTVAKAAEAKADRVTDEVKVMNEKLDRIYQLLLRDRRVHP